jgi:hypothetical protein
MSKRAAGAGSYFSRTFMSRKLELQAFLRLNYAIQGGERYLELEAASAANGDDRNGTQPFRHLEGSFLRFHSPAAFVGTSFRDANSLNLELCSCRADRSADRIGSTSPFSAFVALNKSSRILSSSRRVKTISNIHRSHDPTSMEQTPYKATADAVAPHPGCTVSREPVQFRGKRVLVGQPTNF